MSLETFAVENFAGMENHILCCCRASEIIKCKLAHCHENIIKYFWVSRYFPVVISSTCCQSSSSCFLSLHRRDAKTFINSPRVYVVAVTFLSSSLLNSTKLVNFLSSFALFFFRSYIFYFTYFSLLLSAAEQPNIFLIKSAELWSCMKYTTSRVV